MRIEILIFEAAAAADYNDKKEEKIKTVGK